MAKKAKREDGRYQVVLDLGRDESGKRKRKYFYGATQREANEKKNQYIRQTQGLDIPLEKCTLKDWIDEWVGISSPSPTAQKNNRHYAEMLYEILPPATKMQSINMSAIQRFANTHADKSFSHVTKLKSVINRVFADAIRNRLIAYNPADGINWSNAGKGTHRTLEPWEKDLISENYDKHRVGIWAMLMLYAGLRRGEALALEWDDIDLVGNVIHVRRALHFEGNESIDGDTKTDAGVRDVPLMPRLKAALESIPGRSGRVCQTATGGEMTSSAFKRGWESYLNAMENILNGEKPENQGKRNDLQQDNVERKKFSIRTHDLRHTFCTMLYTHKIGLKEAQYIMGHADIKMTLAVYTHLDQESKKEAFRKLTTSDT